MSDPNAMLTDIRMLNHRLALATELGTIAALGIRLAAAVSDLDTAIMQDGRLPDIWHRPPGIRDDRPADPHGNRSAREGCDRCRCGCKYWENDRCVDCHTAISELFADPAWRGAAPNAVPTTQG